MALKIPESPNIIGGQAVLRQPSSLQGTTVTPDFRTDIKAPAGAFAKIAGAYAEHVERQNQTLLTDTKNGYIKYMSDTIDELKRTRKRKDAWDLYPSIKEASDKYVNDIIGAPKDDGKLRIANKQLQQQFKDWVATQQPSYISWASSYGSSEWQKYEEEVFNTNDELLVNQIASTDSEETIRNAINGLMANSQSYFAGGDPRHIAAYAAAKVDSGLTENIRRHIATNPIGALDKMSNQLAEEGLSSESKKILHEEIIKSYEAIAARELGENLASGGDAGSTGLLDVDVMSRVYQTSDVDVLVAKQTELYAEGEKNATAYKKQAQGVKSAMQRNLQTAMATAKTPEEREAARLQLLTVNPKAATVIDNAYKERDVQNESLARVAALEQSYITYDRFVETREGIATEQLSKALQNAVEDYNKVEVRLGAPGKFSNVDWSNMSKEDLVKLNKKLPKEYRLSEDTIKGYDEYADRQVGKQLLLYPEDEKALRTLEKSVLNRRDQFDRLMDLSSRIAQGDQTALDAANYEGLEPDYVMQLLDMGQVENEYINLSDELKNAYGTDLDSVMSGVNAEYKNYSLASRNALKRNIVMQLRTHIKRYGMPDHTQLEHMVQRASLASASPVDSALRQVLLNNEVRVLDAMDINPSLMPAEARKALEKFNMRSVGDITYTTVSKASTFTKTSDKTVEKEEEKARKILEELAGHDALTTAQKDIIDRYEDLLVPIVMAGNWMQLSTMIQFMK